PFENNAGEGEGVEASVNGDSQELREPGKLAELSVSIPSPSRGEQAEEGGYIEASQEPASTEGEAGEAPVKRRRRPRTASHRRYKKRVRTTSTEESEGASTPSEPSFAGPSESS
ncbi:MAG: hypothetical protein OEV28_11730, partial [Nitrospirota bacterium]|nr:hypothetical protein [Nitrospirota bacterium]